MATNDIYRLLYGIFFMFIFLLAKKGVETHPLAEFFNFFFPFFLTLLKFIYDDIDYNDQPPQRRPRPIASCINRVATDTTHLQSYTHVA